MSIRTWQFSVALVVTTSVLLVSGYATAGGDKGPGRSGKYVPGPVNGDNTPSASDRIRRMR